MTLQSKLTERLISYAKIDTQSNEDSEETPTTKDSLSLQNS